MSFNAGQSRRQAYANLDDESLIDWDQSSAEMHRLKQIQVNANTTNNNIKQ